MEFSMFRIDIDVYSKGPLSLNEFESECMHHFDSKRPHPPLNPHSHNLFCEVQEDKVVKNGASYIRLIGELAEQHSWYQIRLQKLPVSLKHSISFYSKSQFAEAVMDEEIHNFNLIKEENAEQIFKIVLEDCADNNEQAVSILKIFNKYLKYETNKKMQENLTKLVRPHAAEVGEKS